MSGAITEVHRRIMQHLMGKGYAEKGELGKLFTELKLEHKEHWASRGTSLADLVNELNQALSTNQLHMRIGTIKHPIKNLTFWGLINEVDKKEDMVNRMATRYSVQELEFFKSILAKIAGREKQGITKFEATENQNLSSVSHAERVVGQLLTDGWLEEIVSNRLWYGVRTLLDLKMYMEQENQVDILQ